MINLEICLKLIAGMQIFIAIVNLFLVRILGWEKDVRQMPLLVREVFQVHLWFISVILLIFGFLTWRFAAEMQSGSNAVATWLAGAMGLFWLLRVILQVVYYSGSHWRGQAGRTLIHVMCLAIYSGMMAVDLWAFLQGKF